MTPTNRVELTRQELDAIAWKFLGSEFAGPMYADSADRPTHRYLPAAITGSRTSSTTDPLARHCSNA